MRKAKKKKFEEKWKKIFFDIYKIIYGQDDSLDKFNELEKLDFELI